MMDQIRGEQIASNNTTENRSNIWDIQRARNKRSVINEFHNKPHAGSGSCECKGNLRNLSSIAGSINTGNEWNCNYCWLLPTGIRIIIWLWCIRYEFEPVKLRNAIVNYHWANNDVFELYFYLVTWLVLGGNSFGNDPTFLMKKN